MLPKLALCRALGWAPPKEVVDASVASSPHMPDEPYERMYWKAQRVRSEAPGAFLNYPYIIARLPMDFDFPVIVYKDKTVFLKDKASLRFFNIGYLTRTVLRRMLLQANIGVTLPCSPLEAEKASYTAELEHILEGLLGFRVPVSPFLDDLIVIVIGSGAPMEWLHTCTIITGEPNELVARIHTRMPVILGHITRPG